MDRMMNLFSALPQAQQAQPQQSAPQFEPELMKAVMLFLQLLAGQGKIPNIMPNISSSQTPQVQIPQVGSYYQGLYGQKGNIYGQLANLFGQMSKPNMSGMGTWRR